MIVQGSLGGTWFETFQSSFPPRSLSKMVWYDPDIGPTITVVGASLCPRTILNFSPRVYSSAEGHDVEAVILRGIESRRRAERAQLIEFWTGPFTRAARYITSTFSTSASRRSHDIPPPIPMFPVNDTGRERKPEGVISNALSVVRRRLMKEFGNQA